MLDSENILEKSLIWTLSICRSLSHWEGLVFSKMRPLPQLPLKPEGGDLGEGTLASSWRGVLTEKTLHAT